MCQPRIIGDNKWTTLPPDVASGEGCACEGMGAHENSRLDAEFCCDSNPSHMSLLKGSVCSAAVDYNFL